MNHQPTTLLFTNYGEWKVITDIIQHFYPVTRIPLSGIEMISPTSGRRK